MNTQRQIKFRAWDGNKMWMPDGGDRNPLFLIGGILTFMKGLTPMQFTGLLDKNGREIYEGDIVTLNNYPGYWEVFWDNNNGRAGFSLKRIGDSCPSSIRSAGKEVIGNIYSNPELLNV